MGKYSKLNSYLINNSNEYVKLSFKDIEKIISNSLPFSARNYKAWWGNGGHIQSNAWIDAGYLVTEIDQIEEYVVFTKSFVDKKLNSKVDSSKFSKFEERRKFRIGQYSFEFVESIVPQEIDGEIVLYSPQEKLKDQSERLHKYGEGYFCKFKISKCNCPGVYIWVVDSNVIYIGETQSLSNRINNGYGNISPRNCYDGGQTTNCKMNKVVIDWHRVGKKIDIYFLETNDHKKIEKECLKVISSYGINLHNYKY